MRESALIVIEVMHVFKCSVMCIFIFIHMFSSYQNRQTTAHPFYFKICFITLHTNQLQVTCAIIQEKAPLRENANQGFIVMAGKLLRLWRSVHFIITAHNAAKLLPSVQVCAELLDWRTCLELEILLDGENCCIGGRFLWKFCDHIIEGKFKVKNNSS